MKQFKTLDAALRFELLTVQRNPVSFKVGFQRWTMLHGNLVAPGFVKVEHYDTVSYCVAKLTQGVYGNTAD